jgi:tetratricopeptide (TPR) repeat protein
LHRLGDTQRAEAAYKAILKTHPNTPDALFLLGMLLVQTARPAEALPFLRRTTVLAPGHAPFHVNLGSVHGVLGQHEDALSAFDAALAIDPTQADAHANRGLALVKLGRYAEALTALDTALARVPTHVGALDNRGVALRETGQREAALTSHDAALARQPNYAPAHNNRGATLQALGRYEDALAAYDRSLNLSPNEAETHNNRAVALQALGRYTESRDAYDQALVLRPAYPDALANRAVLFDLTGDHQAALTGYEGALALRPNDPSIRFNAAVCRLRLGDLAQGWRDFEHRWQTRLMASERRNFEMPRWTGEPVGRILLHAEQGFGDTLQFCRYASLVADRGIDLVLEVQPTLVTLLGRLDPRITVLAQGEPLPAFDAHAPLMSLPLIFGTDLGTIPSAAGYLTADPTAVESWRHRLPARSVGVVWAGSPRGHDPDLRAADQRRSLRLDQLAPLAEIPGIAFVSLQKGEAATQTPPAGMTLLDHAEKLTDFAATAALVSALDLVVTVDTAVAHLAGALGVPVWVLNRFDTCWRWLLDREDSPWYASLRLFRQPSPGVWDDAIGELASALTRRFQDPRRDRDLR